MLVGVLPRKMAAVLEASEMDRAKCDVLKAELEEMPGTPVVAASRFFDGNDDEGSIGCNLETHPGIPAFSRVFEGIAARSDVEGVWVQIFEIDPDEEAWPYSDTVVVAGLIAVDELRSLVRELEPDDVADAQMDGYRVSDVLTTRHERLLVVWWD